MTKIYKLRSLLLILASVLLTVACKRDDIRINRPEDENSSLTVGSYIQNNYECTILAAALNYTGLMDTLNNRSGSYTLLAPDDIAFRRIGINSAAQVTLLNKDSLRKVLLYHILPVRLLQGNFPKQRNYPVRSLEGNFVLLTQTEQDNFLTGFSGAELRKQQDLYVPGGTDPLGGVQYFLANSTNFEEKELANGVVQRLDRPIRPYFDQTVQSYLAGQPQYSIFVAGLKKFGLWEELSEKGPFTVCAPTNSTLIKWGLTMEAVNALNVQSYNGALLFGTYIFYDRQILLKDLDLQEFYADQPRNAAGYYRFLMGPGTAYVSESWTAIHLYTNRYLGFAYSLVINKVEEPWGYTKSAEESAKDVLGINDFFPPDPNAWRQGQPQRDAIEQLPNGLDMFSSNNLCSNGVVHPFHALTVLPQEARK